MSIFRMSRYQKDRSVLAGCHRMLVEFKETFARRTAIGNAMNLAENISASFDMAMRAIQEGHINAEERGESVKRASHELQTASAVMRDSMAQTRSIRIEWTESFDRMEGLLSKMREGIGHAESLIGRLKKIQGILDESGFHMNISSLNAIVNAARAGERGEIFAAVAEETRKASKNTREHIREILVKINEVNQSIKEAGEMFVRFDAGMKKFKETSDKIIAMSNEILSFSSRQEEALDHIKPIVKKAEEYVRKSRNRYRSISARKEDIRGFLDNLRHILGFRSGVWGPYRLNKKISLDNQRLNVEGLNSVAVTCQRLIREEVTDLADQDREAREARFRLQALSDSFREFIDAAESARRLADTEMAEGLEKIAEQGRQFGEKTRHIPEFIRQVEKIKSTMRGAILFNDMLPLVANVAAMLAEGRDDLRFRVQELEQLLGRLRSAIGDIEQFLMESGGVVSDMNEMYRDMVSEMNGNRNTAATVKITLDNVIQNAGRLPEQMEHVAAALSVIAEAMAANSACAESIDTETEGLAQSVKAYIGILDYRKD